MRAFVAETAERLQRFSPGLFSLVARCYQAPFILGPLLAGSGSISARRLGDAAAERLFGYYDKCPWNRSGSSIAVLAVPFADHHPSVADSAWIELIDTDGGSNRVVSTTHAWNVQMGARLQWLGPDHETQLFWNDYRNGQYVGVALRIADSAEHIFPRPVYDITPNGQVAISIDFERLHVCRPGYGYFRPGPLHRLEAAPVDDGIWTLDCPSGRSELTVTFADIVRDSGAHPDPRTLTHFNHLMIDPSGKRYMFLFRWVQRGRPVTSLYTANLDGTGLWRFPSDGHVSHATWRNDHEILAWAGQTSQGRHFHLFEDGSARSTVVGSGTLTEDGHPSFSPCGRYLLLDTYNDRARRRRIMIYDLQTRRAAILGSVYTPFRYSNDVRCDLHPRWSSMGDQICFDGSFEGKRQVYVAPFRPGILFADTSARHGQVV